MKMYNLLRKKHIFIFIEDWTGIDSENIEKVDYFAGSADFQVLNVPDIK